VAALALEVALGIAEDDVVAGAPRDLLYTPHDEREEGVRYVRDDDAERVRPALDQPAREAVRHVAELLDRRLDAAARPVADPAAVVDHPRHGHRGHAAVPCAVVEPTAPPPVTATNQIMSQ